MSEESNKKVLNIRTKGKYVFKCVEYRAYNRYWFLRLTIYNVPDYLFSAELNNAVWHMDTDQTSNAKFTHFQKYNQHGIKSTEFKLVQLLIVKTPDMYKEFIKTKYCFLIVGE